MVVARRPARRLPIIIAAIVVLVFLFSGSVARFYTDLLWFREVGKTPVFWGVLRARLLLGAVAGLGTALLIWLNLTVVTRISPRPRIHLSAELPTERYRVALGPYLRPLRIGTALLIGFLVALSSSAQWQTFLLWRNRVPFGQKEAQFHRDIGYFVFTLPFLRAVFGWLMFSLVLTTLITAAAHYLYGGIRPEQPGRRVAPQVQAHLSVLLGAIVLLKAWGYYLDRFSLDLSARGVVTGASYTDVHAQLPALKLLLVVAIICALLFIANIRIRSFLLPGIGVILLVVFAVALGGIYPTIVQRFSVAPQELQKERVYIQRNIDATRQAFALKPVETKEFAAASDLSAADIAGNKLSIDNIRLWEPDILKTVFDSKQAVGQTYAFEDVDVDRYRIDGAVRQVMISPREVAPQNLQPAARTWQNLHLTYTHGYGVVAAQVNRTVQDGQPDLVDANFDQRNAKIPVTSPRIYFGEPAPDAPLYVVAKSKQAEVDTPQEIGGTTKGYEGKGGITMSNIVRRLAFALRFRDVNLLISGNIDGDSRMMFNRDIRTRLETVAPFLQWDADPYVAVVDKRIVFIRDGYTTTANYPYSQRIDLGTSARLDPGSRGVHGPANYIRNSVKAVVDAYDGTVKLYAFDKNQPDPLLRAYQKAFPGLFLPASGMSGDLQAHLRYPEDLFSIQTERYASYHIGRADDFYSKQDFWALPDDPSGDVAQGGASQLAVGGGGATKMRPYYLLTGLPGESQQFVLVMPFTPNNRQNMVAYMAARSDKDTYGKITLFSLPRSQSVAGPTQVNAQILQKPEISRELSLLNQQGSKVTLGNLLVVPVNDALIYVQPIFLQASRNAIPALYRVASFYNNKIGYADTLATSLGQIFGQGVEPPSTSTGNGGTSNPPVGTTVQQLLTRASAAYVEAQASLKKGDLAGYQAKINEVGSLVQQAQRASAASPATSSTQPTATTAPPR